MDFTEEMVTNENNALHVQHIILKGTNHAIGKKLAELAKEKHNFTLEYFKDDMKKENQALKNYLLKHFPIYYQRMQGIAEAFGMDFEDNDYDFSNLAYNLDLPQQKIGCSSIYVPPKFTENNEGLLSRNYDFPLVRLAELLRMDLTEQQRKTMKPMMAEPYVVELYPQDEGYSSLFITAFDLLAGVLDGVNSEGLTVCLNGDEIAMAQNFQQGVPSFGTKKIGLNELQVMRLLLDTCATVKEAKIALKENSHYFSFIPCHYLIADKNGESFIFEVDHQEKSIYFTDGEAKPQVMTNHPVQMFPSIEHFPEKSSFLEAGTSSFQRYSQLLEQLESELPPYSFETIKSLCDTVAVSELVKTIPSGVRMQILSQPGLSMTLWHCIYNCHKKNLQVKFLINKEVTDEGGFKEEYSDYYSFKLKN